MKKFDREPIAWITRGGKHVPIFEGDDKNELSKLTEQEWMDNEDIVVGGKMEVGESGSMDNKGRETAGTLRYKVLWMYKEGTSSEQRFYGFSKTPNLDWSARTKDGVNIPITESKRDAYKRFKKKK